MSCNEWENGTIVIPSKDWPKFKEGLRAAWNKQQEKRRVGALKLHTGLIAASKGKRDFNWDTALPAVIEAIRLAEPAHARYNDYRNEARLTDDVDFWALGYLVLPYERRKLLGSAGGPLLPKLKDLPDANGATKTFAVDGGEGSVTLDETTHAVTWRVSENNHAIERARSHPIGATLFRLLAGITWIRGSGGIIIGNNEYNRDNDREGGGGNTVNQRFGPEGRDPCMVAYEKKRAATKKRAAAVKAAPARR